MFLTKTISAPLPWLTIIIGKVFEKRVKPGFTTGRHGFELPRTLEFTREGKRFTALIIIIGVAAINTGNNLLYMVVAMLLSLIVISGIMSEVSLRKLSVKRKLPERIFRQTPALASLHIENRKKLLPSYSFWVEEVPVEGMKSEAFYMVKLEGGSGATVSGKYVFQKRGKITLKAVRIKTSFPFGLFIKGSKVYLEEELIVYPAIKPVKDSDIADMAQSGHIAQVKKGQGSDIYGLRDYTLFDDSRLIHWKASAKRRTRPPEAGGSGLVKKEFLKDSERHVLIRFDNFMEEEGRFEDLVDKTASLANHYFRKGYAVGLKTLSHYMPPSNDRDALDMMLRALALIEPLKHPGRCAVRVEGL